MPERIRRIMRSGPVALAIFMSIGVHLFTAVMFIVVSTTYSTNARQDICDKVERGFDEFTDALVVTFAGGQTPGDDLLKSEALLRATFEDTFEDCS